MQNRLPQVQGLYDPANEKDACGVGLLVNINGVKSHRLVEHARRNVRVDEHQQSSVEKVFAAGDASTGASLVVRCIASGRNAAKGINRFLK